MACDLSGVRLIDPEQLFREVFASAYVEKWARKANSIRVPIGPDYSEAKLLVLKADFDRIKSKADDLTLTFRDDHGHSFKFQKLCLTSVENVLPTDDRSSGSVLLLTLADRRRWFDMVRVGKRYNVRDPDTGSFVTATLNAGVAWTAQEIFDDIWAILRAVYTDLPVTSPSDIGNDDAAEGYEFTDWGCWEALCRLADTAYSDRYLRYDPTRDRVYFGDTSTDRPVPGFGAAHRLRTWDSGVVNTFADADRIGDAVIPDRFAVSFPRPGRSDRHVEVGSGLDTTTPVWRDDMPAVEDPVSNTVALQARAGVLYTKWRTDQSSRTFPRVLEFIGCVDWCSSWVGGVADNGTLYTEWAVYDLGPMNAETGLGGGLTTAIRTGAALKELGGAGFGSAAATGAGTTVVVPMALVTATLPTGCDPLDTTSDQCWGPFYFARIVTWDADCGSWVDGDCVYLHSVSGQRLVLDRRYDSWPLGAAPAEVEGAGVPVDFPCEYPAGTPLYGTRIHETRTMYVGDALSPELCPDEGSDGYVRLYECVTQVWDDCDGWTTVGTGYAFDVNGCTLTPATRYDGQFERMLTGDELDAEGEPRECVELYSVRREKNQQIRIACEGGDLNVYGPDPLDPCGDDETFLYTAACCDPDCAGGGGGGGGEADCCGRTLNSTLHVSVTDEGVFNIFWDGSTYWQGSALLPCGETLHLRMDLDCLVEYSCTGDTGEWAPAAAAIGSPTCTPTFISVQWTVNMDDTGTPSCITGKCGSLTLYIQE